MKLLEAFVLSASLLSSPINASTYPRCQQSLAIVAFFAAGAGIASFLLNSGINSNDNPKTFAGFCVLVATAAGSVFMICAAPHNWYGTE